MTILLAVWLVCAGAAPPVPVQRISDLAYASDDLDAHRLDLYVPQGITLAPMVVFVHGGAFMYGGSKEYAWVGEALAHQGLAVAVVSYRLWPQADAGGAIADVAKATAWTIARAGTYHVSPVNVFLVGHSAGAQIVAIAGTDRSYLRTAGSSLNAIRGVFAVGGAYDVRDLSGEPDSWQVIDGHIYGQTPQARSAYSPVAHIDADSVPTETACGTHEDPWSCDRAIGFATALRNAGIASWAFKEIGTDHMGMLRALVSPGDPLNAEFHDFIARLEVAAASPAPGGGLAELDRLTGTWDGTGTFVDGPYSKAGTARATTTCAWSDDRIFLICQQSVMLDGKPDHDVAIYTYDAATGKYHFYSIGVARANTTTLTVSGNTITYSDSFTDGSKHVLTRTLNVWDAPQSYAWRSEYSLDGGTHWLPMGSGRSTRVH